MLSERARKVYVVHRRDRLRARSDFVAAANKNKNIEFLRETEVTAVEGDTRVRRLMLRSQKGIRDLEIDALLIRIGVQPNSEVFRAQLEMDESGYIKVNSRAETSRPNVFAIGDIANPTAPTITTATGTGATAAKSIFALLNSVQGL